MTHPLTTALALALLVAAGGCASVPEVESRLKTIQFHPNMYVVQAGDTLESIAYRYLLSPAEIVAMNPGADGPLAPGLRINVRPGTELPETVRARAGRWGPEDDVVEVPAAWAADAGAWSADAGRTREPSLSRAPVVVSPVSTPRVAAPRVTDEVLLADDAPAYVPAGGSTSSSVWSDTPAASGWPREEIVPDDLDIAPEDARAALDEELQHYVGRWTWPTDGALARRFAPERANGQGVDIAGVPGQDVRAALGGTVVYAGRDLNDEGNLVIVRHDDELMTTYSHADRLFVAEDDEVLAGDPIASLGWNDRRESVLRFEVRRDGEPLDPMVFLTATP